MLSPISNIVKLIQVIQIPLRNIKIPNYDHARATQTTNFTASNPRNETGYD